jgi:hypothetical protein
MGVQDFLAKNGLKDISLSEDDCTTSFKADIKKGADELKSDVKQDTNRSDDCSDSFVADIKKGTDELKTIVKPDMEAASVSFKAESFLESIGMKSTIPLHTEEKEV